MNKIKYPFKKYEATIPGEWIDFNNHVNSKYYGLIAYDAHIMFIKHLELDENYKNQNNCTTVVVESHITYENELCEADEIEVVSWLICHDEKRMHSLHELYCKNKGYRAAVAQQLDIHVDLSTRSSSPFPEFMLRRLSFTQDRYNEIGRHKMLEDAVRDLRN